MIYFCFLFAARAAAPAARMLPTSGALQSRRWSCLSLSCFRGVSAGAVAAIGFSIGAASVVVGISDVAAPIASAPKF